MREDEADGELPLGETLAFLRATWALDHALQKASRRTEATLGVTAPQRMVLRIVGRFPGIPAGKLARVLHLHPSTVTGIVRRLTDSGLVTRWPDPRDERRVLVGLTARGRALDVDAPGTVEAAVQRLLDELGPERAADVAATLRRLAELVAASAS
jgi:MarR family transcriptional regulator, organic hydroperoxide resistance regulator